MMRLQITYTRYVFCFLILLHQLLSPCMAQSYFDKFVSGSASFVSNSFNYVKDNSYCMFTECCNHGYIKSDVDGLPKILNQKLFGQHIAKQSVVNAIGGHLKNIDKSVKPLVLSLHGSPGTGKNYVAEIVTEALYKKGANSKFVHKYVGRIDFPQESEVEVYMDRLVRDIKAAVSKCQRTLFVFDEVDKMPAGLFDSIVSLLDHHSYTKKLDFRQSIFIFLSNVGGPEIAKKLKQLLDSGKWREHTQLSDFEQTLEITSYNLKGGLYRSEIIESHVVDHFIPFLPLEKRHVESCVKMEYSKLTNNVMPDFDNFVAAVLKEAITFDDTGLFSNNGCKRISKKVESLHFNRQRKQLNEEL